MLADIGFELSYSGFFLKKIADLRDIERVTYPDLRDGSNRHVTTSSYDMTKKRVTASPKETVLPRQEYASWGSPLVAGRKLYSFF